MTLVASVEDARIVGDADVEGRTCPRSGGRRRPSTRTWGEEMADEGTAASKK